MSKYSIAQVVTGIFLAAVVVLALGGCSRRKAKNQPPVIQGSIIVQPATVPVGGRASITAIATDPDRDNIVYYWEAQRGTVPAGAQGDTIWYIAPDTSGLDRVTVTVNDGQGTATQRVQISVIDSSPTSPTDTPVPPPTQTPTPTATPTPLLPSEKVINAIRVDQPPKIDGHLDEEIWSLAQPLTYAMHPVASGSTTAVVKLLWNDQCLYAGFDVSDTQVESSSQPWNSDSVSVIIDNGGQIQEYRHSLLADVTQGVTSRYQLKGTFNEPSDQDVGYSIEMCIHWSTPPDEGSAIPADFLSVDHDENPEGAYDNALTVFSKMSWDEDGNVETANNRILLLGQH